MNYHHLLYFWSVGRRGSLAAAARDLHVSPPTVSVQVRRLEEAFGERLLTRSGRKLELTEVGAVVFRYAEEIFSLGRELLDTVKGRPTVGPLRLIVGVADVLPKMVVHRLIEPALRQPQGVRILCREGSPELLLAELAGGELDVVLTDAPAGTHARVRAHSHLLGESAMSFVGVPALARRCRAGFPRSLSRAPLLLPTANMAVRRSLDEWLRANDVHPEIVGEFEDEALLREFGASGHGLLAVPAVVERQLHRFHGLELVGRATTVRAQFYAVSPERRIGHPAVAAVCAHARDEVFGLARAGRRAGRRPGRRPTGRGKL